MEPVITRASGARADGDDSWNSLHGLAAFVGAMVGIVLGGVLALRLARLTGIDESVADYGRAYRSVIGGAWLGGAVGCYLALRLVADSRGLLTAVVFAMLLPVPLVLRAALGPWDGWDFWNPFLALFVEVLFPLVSPLIAYFLARLVLHGGR